MSNNQEKEIIKVDLSDLISEVISENNNKSKRENDLLTQKIRESKIEKENIINVNLFDQNKLKEEKREESDAEVVSRELSAVFMIASGFFLFNLEATMNVMLAINMSNQSNINEIISSFIGNQWSGWFFIIIKVLSALYFLWGIKKLIVDEQK